MRGLLGRYVLDLDIFWTCFLLEERGRVWFVHFWACLMNYDGFNLFLCDTDPHVDLSALHSTRNMTERVVAGLLGDILMGSWWKWKLTLHWPPPSFSSPLFFLLSMLSLSLKHSHSRKNPIIEISGPCWKRDSLWNVFGVTQRQCLSCPSANRMLCAGECREIRTDSSKRERQKKKEGGGTKGAKDNRTGTRKKHLGDWWCWDDLMTPGEAEAEK